MSRLIPFVIVCSMVLLNVHAQTTIVIPANEAAAHIGDHVTVEGVVAKVFTSKNDNTFLNIGAAYPNQTFTGWIPPTSGQLSRILNAFIVATLIFPGRWTSQLRRTAEGRDAAIRSLIRAGIP